jgi:hypothetical protein
MIDSIKNPAPTRRWLNWRSGATITSEAPKCEPSKPSEPGFDGFDGSPLAESNKIGGPSNERREPHLPAGRCPKSIPTPVDSSTATERVMSWVEWKAGALNQLFLELGNTGQPGRITADTIRHGGQVQMNKRDVVFQKTARSE